MSAGNVASRPLSQDTPLSVALFSDRQIALASFLATPLAGGLMFGWNAWKTGRNALAVVSFAASVAGCVSLIALSPHFPTQLMRLLMLGLAFALGAATRKQFPQEIEQRREAKSGWQSNWTVAGLSIACLAAVVGVALSMPAE